MMEPIQTRLRPDQLVPNPWNPNEMDDPTFEKEVNSIRKYGFVDPITVRALPSEGDEPVFQIVDGENRWRAAKLLELQTVPVTIIDVDQPDAEALTHILNELRGKPNPQKLAALVRDLAQKRSMSELESVLPLRRQQLAQMVAERREQIDWDSLQQKPEPTAEKKERWVERVFRMPQSAANVVDEALAKVREDGVEDDWKALELICADYVAGT